MNHNVNICVFRWSWVTTSVKGHWTTPKGQDPQVENHRVGLNMAAVCQLVHLSSKQLHTLKIKIA